MTRSFWIDEILTYELATQPLSTVLSNNSYPLSYALVHYALKFGDTESLLRLPSYVAGLLGVWLMYFLGRACHSRQAGLVASLLLAFNSIHVFYSQDGRFYALMTLAAIITLWSSIRWLQESHPKYLAAFAGGVAAGSLTHPFFLPFLASLGFGLLVAVWSRPRAVGYCASQTVWLAFFTGLGLLPLISVYLQHKSIVAISLLSADADHQRRFLLEPGQYKDFVSKLLLFQAPFNAGLVVVLCLFGAGLLLFRKRWKTLPAVAVAIVMPIPFFLFPVTHWFSEKYFIAQLPALLLFLAVFLVESTKMLSLLLLRMYRRRRLPANFSHLRKSAVVQVILLSVFSIWLTLGYLGKNLYDEHWSVGWKDISKVMGRYMTGDDVVVHFAHYAFNPQMQNEESFEPTPYTLDFYLKRQVGNARTELYPTVHLETASIAGVDHWLRQYAEKNVWLVFWYNEPPIFMAREHYHLFSSLIYNSGQRLFVAGAPTTNLIEHGAIEISTVKHLQLHGNATIVPLDDSKSCLKLIASTHQPSPSVRFKFSRNFSASNQIIDNTAKAPLPEKNYTLSMKLAYTKVPGNSVTTGAMTIAMQGVDTAGNVQKAQIADFYGNNTLDFYSYFISHDKYRKLLECSDLELEIGIEGDSGIVWVDEVQLEVGDHPTPFVEGTRLPHDISLQAVKQTLSLSE